MKLPNEGLEKITKRLLEFAKNTLIELLKELPEKFTKKWLELRYFQNEIKKIQQRFAKSMPKEFSKKNAKRILKEIAEEI